MSSYYGKAAFIRAKLGWLFDHKSDGPFFSVVWQARDLVETRLFIIQIMRPKIVVFVEPLL